VRISIFTKLFISLFVTSLLLIIGMTMIVSYNFKTGFQDYQNQVEEQQVSKIAALISEHYSQREGWDYLRKHPELLADAFTQLNIPPPLPERPRHDFQAPVKLEWLSPLSQRIYIIDTDRNWIIGHQAQNKDSNTLFTREIPIYSDSAVVGWVILQQKIYLDGPIIERFYEQQQTNLFWIVALAGLASFFVALLLVGRFLAPLKHLKHGANSLSQGHYDYQFQTHGNDEFGELATRFQHLAKSLKTNQSTRQQWITDISHELRTPVSVLRSELEAIQDGIRQPNEHNINSMHHQVIGLGRLIDDLYQLAKSDSGAYQLDIVEIAVVPFLERVLSRFEHRANEKGIDVELSYDPQQDYRLFGDEKMLEQLWANIIENSLRYTDAPGLIRWSIDNDNSNIIIRCEDSSPSVDDVHLPKLFDRLYRVDMSRSRLFGGSGLGLSICKNIIAMHNGDIVARRTPLGGLMIEITLKGAR
jgi:two-component system sensor histidine kinase BaeS